MCAAKEIRESRRENNILKESFTNLVHLTSFKSKEHSSTTSESSTKPLKRKDNILERKLRRKKGKYSVVDSNTLETIRKINTDGNKQKGSDEEAVKGRESQFTTVMKKNETLDDIHAATTSTSSLDDPAESGTESRENQSALKKEDIKCRLCKPSDMSDIAEEELESVEDCSEKEQLTKL